MPASSSAFHATRALKPAEPTAKAGLWSGAPPADRSMEPTSAPFRSNHARGLHPSGTTSSQRGLSSQPDSHGWQISTRPPAVRRRRPSRNRSPLVARSRIVPSTSNPSLESSATACPYIGGWVIVDAPDRPHSAACGWGPAP